MVSLHLTIMVLDQEKNTTDCLVDLLKQITKSVDNGQFAIAITLFLHLIEALDTVNHSSLLSKLSCYGIEGLGNLWLKSHVQQRRQTVYVHGVFFRYSSY